MREKVWERQPCRLINLCILLNIFGIVSSCGMFRYYTVAVRVREPVGQWLG